MGPFLIRHTGGHILSSWVVHAGCVFDARIHPPRTRMSGSFKPMQWNACVHRLDLALYSHPKEFWGNGVRTHVNSKGKMPYTGGSEEDQTRDAASHKTSNPTHYRLSYSGPQQYQPTICNTSCTQFYIIYRIFVMSVNHKAPIQMTGSTTNFKHKILNMRRKSANSLPSSLHLI